MQDKGIEKKWWDIWEGLRTVYIHQGFPTVFWLKVHWGLGIQSSFSRHLNSDKSYKKSDTEVP